MVNLTPPHHCLLSVKKKKRREHGMGQKDMSTIIYFYYIHCNSFFLIP